MSAPIIRPNGKTYRPRKAPSVEEFDSYSGGNGFVVLRTHDIVLATEMVSRHRGQAVSPDECTLEWWRLVPFSVNGSGHDYNWITDEVRGVPCVVWDEL